MNFDSIGFNYTSISYRVPHVNVGIVNVNVFFFNTVLGSGKIYLQFQYPRCRTRYNYKEEVKLSSTHSEHRSQHFHYAHQTPLIVTYTFITILSTRSITSMPYALMYISSPNRGAYIQ